MDVKGMRGQKRTERERRESVRGERRSAQAAAGGGTALIDLWVKQEAASQGPGKGSGRWLGGSLECKSRPRSSCSHVRQVHSREEEREEVEEALYRGAAGLIL